MLNEIDLSRIDLNLLVLFDTVMAERHVGRAAARLNLSASAISHGLGRLRRLLNDPLFLRTPKGVVPTARTAELAPLVSEILVQVRRVVASAAPFDPKISRRRFILGAPDGVSAVILPPLLAALRHRAPQVDIGVRQLMPAPGGHTLEAAWGPALAQLEDRSLDIAIMPSTGVPVRFTAVRLYEESFAIAMRQRHPFAAKPTLDHYCRLQHLMVSQSGDPNGFVDAALAQRKLARRVALTVPGFMQALMMLRDSDLVAALPERLIEQHGRDFGLTSVAPPLKLRSDRIQAVATSAALMDAGVSWLFGLLQSIVVKSNR